jgi:N-acylneuraminate cytidylyltransferase
MISVFLPTRKGSERVLGKNTRTFAGISGGLLRLKINQLLECKCVDEIILSTNDEKSIEVANSFDNSKLKVIRRPEHLALSSTSLVDLINYSKDICTHDHIMWTHVTSPFVFAESYESIVEKYFKVSLKGYDSLMTVKALQNFLWDKDHNDLINREGEEKWPRTQDLRVIYEINSAVFLASKNCYIQYSDRIGASPYLFELSAIQSYDVDWEDDFKIAEALYLNLYG